MSARKLPPSEEILLMYRSGMSSLAIARQCGATKGAVLRALMGLGEKRRDGSATRWQKGQHWRSRKPFWDREWLRKEYHDKKRSTGEIAQQFDVKDSAIFFWLRKHGIERRTNSEAQKLCERRDISGAKNHMFGRTGVKSPVWKGGVTPLRQSIYASAEWKRSARRVRRRDKYQCRVCEGKERTEIHHIVPFRVAPLLVFEEWNLVLLCFACHDKADRNWKRWYKRLSALVAGKEESVR